MASHVPTNADGFKPNINRALIYIFSPPKYLNQRKKYIFPSLNYLFQTVKQARKTVRHTRATPICLAQRGDGVAHLVGRDGLDEMLVEPGLARLPRVFGLAVAGDGD